MYQLTKSGVKRLEDSAFIPSDIGNRHWQEYLAWLAEGNEPEPIPTPPPDNSLALTNGKARKTRIARDTQQQAKTDFLKLKAQVNNLQREINNGQIHV